MIVLVTLDIAVYQQRLITTLASSRPSAKAIDLPMFRREPVTKAVCLSDFMTFSFGGHAGR